MFKLVYLILFLIMPLGVFSQVEKRPVIYLNSDGLYIHPNPVVFAQGFDKFLEVKVENNSLIVRNPRNMNYAIVQVIQVDGEQLTLVFRSANPEDVDRNRKLKLNHSSQSQKDTFITYTKRWGQTTVETPMYENIFTRDTNQLSFRTKLNKKTKFSAFLSDTKTEYLDYKRYSSRYLFMLDYKNYYIHHGTMPLYRQTIVRLNQGGSVLGTRAGYQGLDFSLDLVDGRAFLGNNQFGDNVYGASSNFKLFDSTFGLYYFENPNADIAIPTIDARIPLGRYWTITGGFSNQQSPSVNSNISSVNLQYAKDIEGFGLNSFYFSHFYRPDGQVNIIFGDTSTQQVERIYARTGFQLFKNEGLDRLNANFSFARNIGEYNLNDLYNFGLDYRFRKLEVGANYNLGLMNDTFNNTESRYYQINPFLSWSHQHSNKRVSRVGVSSFLSENNAIKANAFSLSLQNSSLIDSHALRFSRNSSEEVFNVKDLPSVNAYSLGYTLGYRIFDNLKFNAGASTRFSNTQQVERENYYLDLYSYYVGANYSLNDNHNFSLKLSKMINLRPVDYDIVTESVFFGYNFRYGTDSINPLQYITKNHSFKAHFYYDKNFNGKKDADEELLVNMPVDLFLNNKLIASKKTDSDGYIRFGGLEEGSYSIGVPSEKGEVISSINKNIDLTSDNTREIGVAHIRNISVKIFDEGTQSFIKSSMSFELDCPEIGYSATQQFNFVTSSVFTIPRDAQCYIAPIPLNFTNNFTSIDFGRKLVDKQEIVYKIKQERVLDIVSNIPISVKIDKKIYNIKDSQSIQIKATEYKFDDIFIPKKGYSCSANPRNIAFHPSFFERKQLEINCLKK